MTSENSFPAKDEIDKLFEAKDAYHREMARLPFEEKIKVLVRLQKLANEVKPASGKPRPPRKVWEI